MDLEDFFRDTKLNAYIGWFLTALIGVALVESVFDYDILWVLFTSIMIGVIILPPLRNRDYRVMVPWEVLLMASIPVVVRTVEFSLLTNQIATYAAMAALALLIAVEIHIFTDVKFNHGFAVGFTVISTLALVGVWSVIRYLMDIYLGTAYLTTNEDLMYEFINVTIAGFLAGLVFDVYFRRRDKEVRKMVAKVVGR